MIYMLSAQSQGQQCKVTRTSLLLTVNIMFSLSGRTPGRAAKSKGQQSIMSMFASMAGKRKSSGDQDNAEKKIKSENGERCV